MAVQVSAIIVPKSGGKWPVVEDVYIRGGFKTYATVAARDLVAANSVQKQTLKVGTVVLTLDTLQLWRYTGVAGALWVEFVPKPNDRHTHIQTESAAVWEVVHGKNCTHFTYSIFGEDGYSFIPDKVQIVDSNTIRIYMLDPVAGSATFSFNL